VVRSKDTISDELTYDMPSAIGMVIVDCCTGFSQTPVVSFGPQVLVLVGVEPRGIRSGSG